jgi:hypothetical protein
MKLRLAFRGLRFPALAETVAFAFAFESRPLASGIACFHATAVLVCTRARGGVYVNTCAASSAYRD